MIFSFFVIVVGCGGGGGVVVVVSSCCCFFAAVYSPLRAANFVVEEEFSRRMESLLPTTLH